MTRLIISTARTDRQAAGASKDGVIEPVARSVALFRGLLAAKDARVRAASAFALAWFPDPRGRAKQNLLARVTRERNEAARASMLISLGFLRATDARGVLDSEIARQTPRTTSAAALGLFYLDGKKAAESVRIALAAASTSKKLGRTQQPWNAGDLAAHAAAVVSKLPASKTRAVGGELADVASLKALPFRQANALAVRLTKDLFAGKAPRKWNAMTPAQRLLLKTIVTAGLGTWRGELDVLLRARGLPWLDQLPRITRAKRGRPKP